MTDPTQEPQTTTTENIPPAPRRVNRWFQRCTHCNHRRFAHATTGDKRSLRCITRDEKGECDCPLYQEPTHP